MSRSRFQCGRGGAARPQSLIYVSGEVGRDSSGKVVPGGMEAEARQCFANIKHALDRAGASFKDVVRITAYVKRSRRLSCLCQGPHRGIRSDWPQAPPLESLTCCSVPSSRWTPSRSSRPSPRLHSENHNPSPMPAKTRVMRLMSALPGETAGSAALIIEPRQSCPAALADHELSVLLPVSRNGAR